MNAICLILIGLMVPPNSYSVDCIPRAISFVVAKDGDLSHSVQLKSRVNESVSLSLVYRPNDIETNESIWMSGGEEYDLWVTLKVPEGTWAEAQEIRREREVRRKNTGRLPPMTMFSRLTFSIERSGGGPDTLVIPLRLMYEFEPDSTANRRDLEERPH